MDEPEYMRIQIKEEYNLQAYEYEGYVYFEINKGMYGIAQSGLLANELLAKRLANHWFKQTQHILGLWKNLSKPIQFTLVVDYFVIKYEEKQDVQYLIKLLREHYEAVTVDWKGELFYSIKIDWNYQNRTVDLSIPGYITKLLQSFIHTAPKRPKHQPH